MHQSSPFVRLGLMALALVTLLYAFHSTRVAQPAIASEQRYQSYSPLAAPAVAPNSPLRLHVTDVDLLGITSFPTGHTYNETEVGGLSGLAYNQADGTYIALSDDRSERNPARFYNLTIDLSDGSLDDGDVVFTNVVTLVDEAGQPFAENTLDPEGIALMSDGRLFLSSEGNVRAEPPIVPFIREFSLDGAQLAELSLPDKYLPQADGTSGVRHNLVFESLTISPNQRYLYAAIEGALAQDGPISTLETESLVRILQYDLASGIPIHEVVYIVDAIPQAPNPAEGFADNGLVDLQPLDNNGSFLALERSFAEGVGNTIRLYAVEAQGALDVLGIDSLLWEEEGIPYEIDPPVHKRLLVDFAELGIRPDNVEGMTFGPLLPDGRQTLVLVSDNNFNESQSTQFIALALTFDAIGLAEPVLETAQAIDADPAEETLADGVLAGDSDDPAIWVHPTTPENSLIFATLKDGGMAIFDLNGNTLEVIVPEVYGGERYNNADIVYGFNLGGEAVDLVVASDRANDTLAIFAIDPTALTANNVTGAAMLETIFGVDDGEQTAYGLATYTDPADGTAYAFVTQRDGNQVAQLALLDDGNGGVTAEIARTISVPLVSDDVTASQSEGIVVDRELGYLYVAMEDGVGILKYSASAATGDDPKPVRVFNSDKIVPDIEGLIIYYGPNGAGYLLASSQGDSSYAIFERSGDNQYIGSFAVGESLADSGVIDQVNESDGFDVINLALGPNYPFGLLVVQDGANDPQSPIPDNEQLENRSTNFKFVPWENVANSFAQPLLIDPDGYQPR